MIGRFNLSSPPIDDELSQMVETHRQKTGQDYAAILMFGLWGTSDCSPEVRLYAAYLHLAANPEDGPIWLETARVHAEAEEYAEAEAILAELVRLGSPGLYVQIFREDPEVEKSRLLALQNQYRPALAILDRLEDSHGDSPSFHFMHAALLHADGDFVGAEAGYQAALAHLSGLEEEAAELDFDGYPPDFSGAAELLSSLCEKAKAELAFDRDTPFDLSDYSL